MPLVAGVDSSTQSCKVVVCDAETGEVVRSGHASHPEGTEVAPEAWWDALQSRDRGRRRARRRRRGGGRRAAARHGLPRRGRRGRTPRAAVERHPLRAGRARPDRRARRAAAVGRRGRAGAGRVVHGHQAALAARRRARQRASYGGRLPAPRLPDLAAAPARAGLDALVTDRGDASGTGYWSPATGEYRRDLLELGLGHDVVAAAGARPGRVRACRCRRARCSAPAPATTPAPRWVSARSPVTSSSRSARRAWPAPSRTRRWAT